MRILQLIDTLDAGGAERMAVNYANALSSKMEFSGIAVTRKEGNLQLQLKKEVNYFFLNKKSTFDFKSVLKLKKIIKTNKINVIHAHGTSFFTSFLVKLVYHKVKIIWHDHYGDSEFLEQRPKIVLRLVSPFFWGIIAVNEQLVIWSKNVLKFDKVIYLPNFTAAQININEVTKLKGNDNQRIICLANFRIQKNHFLLLEVAQKIKKEFPVWTFHLVGNHFSDNYFDEIKSKIIDLNIENQVFIYSNVHDIDYVLSQSSIGILTSKSEGLPVVLLEYGLAKLPVVVTNVGEIGKIINDNYNGFIVESEDEIGFFNKLKSLILNNELQKQFGEKLNVLIKENYSEEAVLNVYFNFLGKNTIKS